MRAGEDVLEEDEVFAILGHRYRAIRGNLARPRAAEPRVAGIERRVHQLRVARREDRIGEAEAHGEPTEDLDVRERLALRRDHALGTLQPVRAVRRVEIGMLEVRGRGQHDVGVAHAVRHCDIRTDHEEILAQEAATEAVLIRMHDHRVVVVDEHRLDRRIQTLVEEVRADVDDVERARARRHEIRPLQAARRFREREPGAVDEPAAGHAELAGEGGQREDGADAAAAVLVPLEAVADADGGGRDRRVPLGERTNLRLGHAADARGVFHGEAARLRHVVVEPVDVARDEVRVERAPPLELGGHRPRQHDVRARLQRDVQVRLSRDRRPARIDDDELGAALARAIDQGHEVKIRPRHVVAPRHDEPRVLDVLRTHAGDRAERAHPRFRADAAAQRFAIEQARAEPVKEAQVHRAAGEEAVRPGVVQREDRLRAVLGHDRGEALVDLVERLVPRDPLEGAGAGATRADATQRRADSRIAVDERRIRRGHLRAEHAVRVRIGVRAADGDDALVLDGHGEAAGVGAVEGTHAT